MRRFISAIALLLATNAISAAQINEFRPNPPGSDPAQDSLELLGTPNSLFSGVLLSVESDGGSSQGLVDYIKPISGTFDSNGLLVTTIDDLENPSFTLLLVDSFSGNSNSDIDTDNDGLVDNLLGIGNILDAIGVSDQLAGGDPVYGAALGGSDIAFGVEPELVFRDALSGVFYSVTGGQVRAADGTVVASTLFNLDPTVATFGSINPTAVPLPAPLWLVVGGLVFLSRTRRRG